MMCQPHRLSVTRKERVYYFIQYSECPRWAGTVLGVRICHRHGPACEEQQAKNPCEHQGGPGTRGLGPTAETAPAHLRDRDTFLKEVGLSGPAGHIGAGWEHFSGVVSAAPMESQTGIAVLSKDHF